MLAHDWFGYVSNPEKAFDRLSLSALDTLGAAAVANGARVDLAIYSGGALMPAGASYFATKQAGRSSP